MIPLAAGLSYLDLHFQGRPGVIATAVVQGPGGVALIDPGPSTTLPVLEAALASAGIVLRDVTSLLLTHIHLDHAGATGTLVRRHPGLRVYVHEKGAPHMADPAKLVASASRLWGDRMVRLWGAIEPVPPAAMTILSGGERIALAGRQLAVEYTPGHASHHVSYFDRDSRIAFVGDTAGLRLRPTDPFVLAPTPPPDIDLELWRTSLARIAAWGADTLFLTHFGPSSPIGPHLAALADDFDRVAALVQASLDRGGTDVEREAWFVDQTRQHVGRFLPAGDVAFYEVAGQFDLSWRGMARYLRNLKLKR
jgi:glyoxylase-like metal-dependent hydrolase (beta-lactamase superfamily II)